MTDEVAFLRQIELNTESGLASSTRISKKEWERCGSKDLFVLLLRKGLEPQGGSDDVGVDMRWTVYNSERSIPLLFTRQGSQVQINQLSTVRNDSTMVC
jgi:hypothetical protein